MGQRVARVKMNVISTLAHQLVTTLCGLVIPWIMIDTFGSTAYGITISIAQFLSYITLLEGGIGRVARGALYKPLAERDDEKISQVYLAVKRFFSTIGLIFAAYVVVLACGYHSMARVTEFSWEYTAVLVVGIAIGKFAEYMSGISKMTLLNADQKQYVVNGVYIATNVLNVLLIVLLAKSGVDILWVKVVSSLVFVLRPVLYSLYVRKHYHLHKTGVKATLPNKYTGIAQHTAYVIQNNTDVMLLTLLADLPSVAVYSVYHLVVFSLRNIATAFTGGMEALLGEMAAKGEQEILRKTYRSYKLILTVLTMLLFGTAAILIVPFVRLYTDGTTDADYVRPLFALIMVVAEALNCLTLPCFNLTIAANKLKQSQFGAYGEAAVNVAVSLVLMLVWDPLVGVAVGTLAATVFKCIYYTVFTGKHILKTKVSPLLLKLAATALALVGMSLGGMWLIRDVLIYKYTQWVVWGFAFAIVTGLWGVALGISLYPHDIKGIKNLLRGKKKAKPADVEEYAHHDIAAYAGYVEESSERLSCSSGGVATALARQMIRRGGYVVGVTYTPGFKEAVYEITNRMEDLERFKGSKYCQVQYGSVYADVKALLDAGESVLFMGLPCGVAGLRGYLKQEYENLVAVELICHGPTSAAVHRQYVEHLERQFDGRLVDFSVKRKKGEWTPAYLYAAFDNGAVYEKPFYHTEYGYAFATMAGTACYTCRFRGNNRTGDMMLGDFWGATEQDAFWNKEGVSSILVHTEKGLELLRQTEGVRLFDTTFGRIVAGNPNIIKPREQRPNRAKFQQLLDSHGLFYAVEHSKPILTRIKAKFKR
ncbi:MAG: Coenzyme F420 hydrogenase/dehydrogenase, beta subunit C-terminal domain [Clostridia bacterium]|nr:Coenzyme F420 hydrogenase/dehydrogenase, beta subunit C-terminal domain [Clostridia bacterium]